MRLGIVVDGKTEHHTIVGVVKRVRLGTGCYVAKADIQPKAPLGQQAFRAVEGYKVLAPNGIDKLLVLVDKEDRKGCDGALSNELQANIVSKLAEVGVTIPVAVVLKVRMYENWLIADYRAFAALPSRFRDVGRIRQRVERNRAETVDAVEILSKHLIGDPYHKVRDGKLICTKHDPFRAAMHSRSFRRFLRVAGCEAYSYQSKKPNY